MSGLSDGAHRSPSGHEDEIDPRPEQLRCKSGEPIEMTVSPSVLDSDILSFNPPEVSQALPERIPIDALARGLPLPR